MWPSPDLANSWLTLMATQNVALCHQTVEYTMFAGDLKPLLISLSQYRVKSLIG